MKSGRFMPNRPLPVVTVANENGIYWTSDSVDVLFMNYGFGRIVNGRLLLSPYERVFLEHICESVNSSELLEQVWRRCTQRFEHFAKKYAVYVKYRTDMWIVRDGSTFGYDFMLYSDHMDQVHSDYGVKVLESLKEFNKNALAASRVAWSIKKDNIFISVEYDAELDETSPECICQMSLFPYRFSRANIK